jgi:hypothetical protein
VLTTKQPWRFAPDIRRYALYKPAVPHRSLWSTAAPQRFLRLRRWSVAPDAEGELFPVKPSSSFILQAARWLCDHPSGIAVQGRREPLYARSGSVRSQVDVGRQSQTIEIVVDALVDVEDRYSPATSSCATTAIPRCMVLRSLCFVKRQAATN